MFSKKYFLLLALASYFQPVTANYDEYYFEALYKEMLQGYDLSMPSLEDSRSLGVSFFKNKDEHTGPISLNPGLQMKLLFDNCFIPSYDQEPAHIDAQTWTELQIVRGTTRATDSLVNRLTTIEGVENSGLATIIGKKRFSEILAMPTTDVAKLQARQNCIKVIQKNTALHLELTRLFSILKETEPYYIDFCTKTSIKDSQIRKYIPWIANQNSASEVHAENITGLTTSTLTSLAFLTYAAVPPHDAISILKALPGIIAGCYAGYRYMDNNAVFTAIQKDIHEVSVFIEAQRSILNIFNQIPGLYQNFPEYKQALDKLEGKDALCSEEFKKLNEHFVTNAQKKRNPSDISWAETFVTFKYLCTPSVRKEFSVVFDIIGEIDGLVTLATKMNAHAESKNALFCYVDFIKSSEKPILNVKNFWNPFVKSADAIPNSVLLNAGAERSMIITGPNTGGKSTNMKGLFYSVLVAQTFGVAPAEKMMFTPFTNISTYLNISDDTGAGKSAFRAELDRAEKLMFSLKSLPRHDFGFVIIDEIFKGTSNQNAEELAKAFIKSINAHPNVIFVNATHIDSLKSLEEETKGEIKNYHVDVHVDSEGRIAKYLYQIIPGASDVNSVKQVAREAGISFI